MLLFELPESITSEIIERPKSDHLPHRQSLIDPLVTQYSEQYYQRQPFKKSSRAPNSRQASDYDSDTASQAVESMKSYKSIDEQSISLIFPLSALQEGPRDLRDASQPDHHRPLSKQKHPYLNEPRGSKLSSYRKLAPNKQRDRLTDPPPLDYVTASNGMSWFSETGEPSGKQHSNTHSQGTDDELVGQILQSALGQLFARQKYLQQDDMMDRAGYQLQPLLWRDTMQANELTYLTRPSSSASAQPHLNQVDNSNNRTAVTQDISNLLAKLSNSSPELLMKLRNILRKASLKDNSSSNGTSVSVVNFYDTSPAKVSNSNDSNNSTSYHTMRDHLTGLAGEHTTSDSHRTANHGAAPSDTSASYASMLPNPGPGNRHNTSSQEELKIPLVVVAMPRKLPVVDTVRNAHQHQESNSQPMEQQLYPTDNFTMPHSNATRPYPPLRWTLSGVSSPSSLSNHSSGRSTSGARLAPYLYGPSSHLTGSNNNQHQLDQYQPTVTTSMPLHTMAPYAHLFDSAPSMRHHHSDKENSSTASSSSMLPDPSVRRPQLDSLTYLKHQAMGSNQTSADDPTGHSSLSSKRLDGESEYPSVPRSMVPIRQQLIERLARKQEIGAAVPSILYNSSLPAGEEAESPSSSGGNEMLQARLRYVPTSISGQALSGSLSARSTLLETLSRLRPLFAQGNINWRSDLGGPYDRHSSPSLDSKQAGSNNINYDLSESPSHRVAHGHPHADLVGRLTRSQLLSLTPKPTSADKRPAGTSERDKEIAMSASSQSYDSAAAAAAASPSIVGQSRAANRRLMPLQQMSQMIDQDGSGDVITASGASSAGGSLNAFDRDQLNESPKVMFMFV